MSKLLLAHYLPWFTTYPDWRHWRGENNLQDFGCDQDGTGHIKIASSDYPLRGPYDSLDQDVIYEQLDEMAHYGIGGVIVNWYGPGEPTDCAAYCDYKPLHDATLKIADCVRNRKMKMSLCFDTHSFAVVRERGAENPEQYMKRSLDSISFSSDPYLQHDDGRTVLLVFGGAKNDMRVLECILADTEQAQRFCVVTEGCQCVPGVGGAFAWPWVRRTGETDRVKPWAEVEESLVAFYRQSQLEKVGLAIGVAFAGLSDIYLRDDRPGEHLEIIARDGGDVYRRSLRMALSHDFVQIVQIATWNDWNEGTQIEPSEQHGTRELRSTSELLGSVPNIKEDGD
jgi:hypothetical protein